MIFDYCINCRKMPLRLSQGLFETLIRQPWLKAMADEIASGNLERKRDLPAACWQATYDGKKRANENAVSSGLFAEDIDDVKDPQALYESFKARVGELGIYVVHKTPSTHGLRIVARCRAEFETIGQNQAWLAAQIGVQHDAATHDMARLSFLVPEEYFYYYDSAVFTDEPAVVLPSRQQQVPANSEGVAPGYSNTAFQAEVSSTDTTSAHQTEQTSTDICFRGVPYDKIVTELVSRTGGNPQEGERNNRLYSVCRMLANITDRKVETLFAICPRFGLSEAEVRACCESACRSARTERLPYVLYKVLVDLGAYPDKNGNLRDDEQAETATTMPAMPPIEHLAPLIREFAETSPEDFRPATALACLPICGFLGSRLRATYVDGDLQAPSFIVNIIAPAASGKGSFLRIADICLEKVRAKDEEGRMAEAEYNRQVKLKKNEKKQIEEPQVIVRDVPAKISVARLLKRMKNAKGLHLISISPEADTLANTNKSGAWAQKGDIYRIAQDGDGGIFGQDYMSDVSFSATCQMRYNLLTLGTPGAMARAYPDVEDGLITRCIMVTLPSQFGKSMPVRKSLSRRQLRIINEKVDALMAISQDEAGNVLPEHYLSLGWLNEGIERWFEGQRIIAVRDDDHARDQFRRRAALIGFRAGMVAAFLWGHLNGERKAHTLEFALWVADYILQSLMERYGQKVNEEAVGYEIPQSKRYPSLFEAMPDVFTLQQLRKAATAQNCKSPLKSVIFRWSENGLIEKQGEEYVKLSK